jgi:hypothetical protein
MTACKHKIGTGATDHKIWLIPFTDTEQVYGIAQQERNFGPSVRYRSMINHQHLGHIRRDAMQYGLKLIAVFVMYRYYRLSDSHHPSQAFLVLCMSVPDALVTAVFYVSLRSEDLLTSRRQAFLRW